MGVRRDSVTAAPGRVVVVDSEVPESGWLSVDLDRLAWVPAGPPGPGAGWDGAREPWRGTAVPRRYDAPAKEPLTIARLEAWAERLRGLETLLPVGNGMTPVATGEPAAEKAPVVAVELIVTKEPAVEKAPVRGIRPEDLVAVGRKLVESVTLSEPPAAAKPSFVRPELKVVAGRSRFSLGGMPSSSGVRFILLCLAAFFLSAGAVHSYGRWKHTRAIVVPATVTPGAVIT